MSILRDFVKLRDQFGPCNKICSLIYQSGFLQIAFVEELRLHFNAIFNGKYLTNSIFFLPFLQVSVAGSQVSSGSPAVTVVQLPSGQTVQVQGVIQTAQPSVIQSPQIQTVQVSYGFTPLSLHLEVGS